MSVATQSGPAASTKLPAVIVALAILAASAPSRAEANWSGAVPAKARTLAERGRMLHDAGDYANAIIAFTQAYVMAPSPALLFNLAQAYRLQGNCDDAALMYRRYLATNPGPEVRALVENHLANVERCIHKLNLNIPIETGKGIGASPPPSPMVTATAPGRSRVAQIEKDVGTGLALGGGVALAIAGYYAVQAHAAANEVADAYAKGAKWRDVAATDERGKSAARSAKLLGAGGGIGVVSGVALYLLGRHTEQTVPVTITPTASGAQVSMLCAF